ncbi:hypothetical protein HPP92_022738 [Vanilla planifolia]|uniref:Uncharacterized protein n=1 Tax=Vanilla planifolia TaxID=51239 RepID=A0A835PP30_VANPL|nr:hypothetical protein HPP92_022738 [Vanilla planifolia]
MPMYTKTSNICEKLKVRNDYHTKWFLPINILLTFAIGSAFGWILVKVTRPPSHLKPILVGCCASGNLGIMLFIVIPNTCTQKGSPFGDPNTCSKQAFAYSSLSSGIYDLIFWSYVYNIVRLSIKGGEMNLSIEQDAYAPDPEKGFELSIPALILWKKMEKFSHSPVMVAINRLFTPSIVGAVLGLIVGVVSPLRKTFIGENAPLRVIQGVIKMLGDGTIPSSTIIMGGNLLKGLRKSEMKTSFVIGVVIGELKSELYSAKEDCVVD